ncbi:MAG: cytochrome P450 [Streptosporangiales bacterium]|jgi:cytochrome P450|nr:cytochrome P450 [Streptosporangiales bacterium]
METSPDEERFREIAYRRSADPAGYFAQHRGRGPVLSGENPWGHLELINQEDVDAALHDPGLFSSELAIMGSAEPPIPIGVDPPLHSEYRRLLDPAFSPRRVAELAPKVADRVNTLIDDVIGQGECDFSRAVSVPLPTTTFIDLLGLPQSQLPTLLYWKDVMIHAAKVAGGIEAGDKLRAKTVPVIYSYIQEVIADRRDKPAGDLITRLLRTRVDGDRALSDNEITRTVFLLISAGLDTVSNSLQCIFHYLATHPEARQLLVDEPGSADNVIEELLRWESPVQSILRTTTRDAEIGECPVKAGSVLELVIGAANIDPAASGAGTVDVRRGDKRHLAFGGGPHRCLGSHLARMELRTVVREWHKRIPDYRLKAGYTPEWNSHPLRGVDHLMLEWDTER